MEFLSSLDNRPRKDYMTDRNDPAIYLERTKYFLKTAGVKTDGFKFIHITGTAGKGTVATMVANILWTAGKKAGVFTSPHVTTPIEEIAADEKYIPPLEFARIVEALKPHIAKCAEKGFEWHPSYFEVSLAVALIYFQKMRCEWVVLEVGAGGRYDATNFIRKPVITAITNIDYDHVQLLGKTLTKIAFGKAGIIKRGSIFWTSEKRPGLLKMFRLVCRMAGAKFNSLPRSKSADEANARLASAIAQNAGIDEKYISEGIRTARLPARFEIVDRKPLTIIDGAHNRIKMADTARKVKELNYRKLNLVIGIAANKNHNDILRLIVPFADRIFFTRIKGRQREFADPKKLAVIAKKYMKRGTQFRIIENPRAAMKTALGSAGKNDAVLATGSFFIAGEIRRVWFSKNWILKHRQSS